MSLIEIRKLSKIYLSNDKESFQVKALDEIDVKIEAGEFVAIMGPSGSGKSTLMQILGLLDRPTQGGYILDGQDISQLSEDELAQIRSQKMGFIFQFFNLLPRTTCLENVGLPLLYAGETNPAPRARELLEQVGLSDRLTHRPHQLSGGQQQRVAIARALANKPQIIFADEPTGNISTQQTEEILNMLDQMNQTGTTIILVTHEPEVAHRARRLITIRDGKVFSDQTLQMPLVRSEKLVSAPAAADTAASSSAKNWAFRLKENCKMAWVSLSLNKLRTSLATLGVVIGIASFVAMMAIGEGAKKAIADQISSFGTNLLNIRAVSSRNSKVMRGENFRKFDLNDYQALKIWSLGKGAVRKVDAQVYGNVTLAYAAKNSISELIGTTPNFEEMQNYKPVVGRFFTEEENQAKARVVLIGPTVAKNFFGDGVNPVGSSLKINRIDYEIIGLLPEKGSTAFKDRDDTVIVPLNTAMMRVLGRRSVHVLTVEARAPELLDSLQDDLEIFLRELHKTPDDQADSFEVRNMNDIKELYSQTTNIISSMLQAIAAVSLLVGGIGIMNVMFVSVKERTREVGLRKAIGGKKADILVQFLVESVLIGLLGGAFGTFGGFFLAQFAQQYLGWQAIVSWHAVLVSFAFSACVGVLFGLWPAKQASELSPIEALRYE